LRLTSQDRLIEKAKEAEFTILRMLYECRHSAGTLGARTEKDLLRASKIAPRYCLRFLVHMTGSGLIEREIVNGERRYRITDEGEEAYQRISAARREDRSLT
jgi:DNA-binding PadR family transcriptional regulator